MKKFKLSITELTDGQTNLSIVNDGFNPYQVLGILEKAKMSILLEIEKEEYNRKGGSDE